MSDAGDEDKGRDGSAGAGGRAPLTLKPRGGAVNAGVVRQSFSHGRSKTVVVETKRRRPGFDERPAVEARPRPQAPPLTPSVRESAQAAPTRPAPPSATPGGPNLNLSQSELEARQ